jgi:protein-export membrane protein SecD
MRRKSAIIFGAVLVISIAAGFFVYPKGFGANTLPWRLGLDLIGGAHLTYEVDMKDIADVDRDSVMDGLRDVIEKRVNLFGVSEPQVYTARSGDAYRLVVELAGIKDVSAAIKEIGETPFLLFAEVDDSFDDSSTTTAQGVGIKPTELTGRYIVGATLTFDGVTGRSQVSLDFNDEGAKIFEALTERNVGKQIAVFLDDNLITAPVVQEKITGGAAQITGQFTPQEARLLVSRFNAGALPAPIEIVSQQTVGATLGTDSLNKTLYAGAIGTGFIILFMLLYYRSLGFFASIALIIYIVLNLLVFKSLSITMTLSGIAGIVLSIGMAVDANILIFERTKEEMKKGLARTVALEEGFRRAWLSIRDSNISTIITSVILYYFTTGFIKGFALALLIGVLVSMFSAITVTRMMLRVFMRDAKPATQ